MLSAVLSRTVIIIRMSGLSLYGLDSSIFTDYPYQYGRHVDLHYFEAESNAIHDAVFWQKMTIFSEPILVWKT